jgi:hypothetical protein
MINCFLVRENNGLTLVNTNFAGAAPGILRAARSLNAPIRRIVLTHAHLIMWAPQTLSSANFRTSNSLLVTGSLAFSGGIIHAMPAKQARSY